MKEKDDLYIRILKWADERESFTYADLREEFGLKAGSISDNKLRSQISTGKFLHLEAAFLGTLAPRAISKQIQNDPGKDSLSISVEDKFRLIEYTELQEARASSRRATWFASAALLVSVVGTVASIFFTIK